MDFGLLYELQTLAPRSRRRDYDLYRETIAQVERADQAGFTHVWAVEHHFRENFSHNSAPEIWLTAVAQRTERIRIGHGVVQTLPQFNHPIRVAERAAALDLASDGRLEMGTGRAVNAWELGGWGITGNTRDMWRESLELIARIWTSDGEPVSFDGRYVSLADRVVVPQPLQDPHPPLWLAASSPASYRLAGELGLGVLSFGMAVEAEAIGRRIVEHRVALASCEPVGAFRNDNVAVFMMGYCAETREEARAVAQDAFNWYLDETVREFSKWAQGAQALEGYEWYHQVAGNIDKLAAARNFDYLLDGGMILCGTPDDLIETIERFENVGATQMILGTAIGGITHEQVLRSIDLIGSEVIPHFARRPAAAPAGQASS
jgi:alkanesulfonate monooxygenase SsuD/methylene tetrahydromethanopterin reductase-like flavin-dependent oxidoreductase (luciferase family)